MKEYEKELNRIRTRMQAYLRGAANEALKTSGRVIVIDIASFLFEAARAYSRVNKVDEVLPESFEQAEQLWLENLGKE